MKLLMLGWELPPHNSGGLGVACYHMAKALAAKGTDIDFVVPYSAGHKEIDFMTIHSTSRRIPGGKYSLGAYDHMSIDGMRKAQKQYVRHVEKIIQANPKKHEVIHAHDWLTVEAGIRAKELTGAPLIVHIHATEFDRAGGTRGNPLVHEIEEQGLLMADKIIAVSNITKWMIVKRYQIPANKVEVVHNAIDVSSMPEVNQDIETYRYLRWLQDDGYTVVSAVTRFTIQKGLLQLLRGFAKATTRYDKLVLLLVGDGEQRDELIRASAELEIADKVFFTGFVRGRKWRDAYGLSDVFVMSSISEPFGLTALEAAHHSNALIISKQSGVGEVLANILRYDFWDERKLADQIVAVASSSALRDELRNNIGREYARLNWRDVAQSCIQLYDGLRRGVAA